MSTEQNKALAQELFARLTASDFAGALGLMADDATWWIAGRKERTPTSGLHSKESIGRLFHAMANALVGGLKMTVLSCIAEADRVALEVVSRGDLKNGRQYRQEYHLLVQVRGRAPERGPHFGRSGVRRGIRHSPSIRSLTRRASASISKGLAMMCMPVSSVPLPSRALSA